MIEGWAYDGAPPRFGTAGTVTLVEGTTFCIAGRSGDISPGTEQGLYFRDTRFLSAFALTVDGQRLDPLAARSREPFAGEFIARRQPRPGTADSTLLVIRRRYVGNGMLERITLRNLGRETGGVILTLHVDADFAGLFEVKEGRITAHDSVVREARPDGLRFSVATGERLRVLTVTGSDDALADGDRLTWHLTVPARGERSLVVQVVPAVDGVRADLRYRADEPVDESAPVAALAAWRRLTPQVESADGRLVRLLQRSAEDLGALRMFDPQHPDRAVIAAGAPWFMTLFGRDALLTSWMLLPVDSTLALGTLHTLAEMQGRQVAPLTEEEPGRIPHELRSGPEITATLAGQDVYYGSVDATPLFVMLLGELRRWGLAADDVTRLLPHADRALEWIERYGDRDGDGFVEYARATDRGLANQGWKDSFDAISFANGSLAEPPIALAEVQAYVYAAYLARAHFAKETADTDRAEHWKDKARRLRERFNAAFWLPDRGYYALALDADKRPVDALASNMGHALWAGIVDPDKAGAVAARLLSDDMFSGFGVRTLARSMGGYNPVSYHNGSIWPHDNAILAAGLARYGFVSEAQRIALGLLDAATHFDHRLPELFCGFSRTDLPDPVPYPTSCSPQAWAAAAPLLLLRSLLRFDPSVPAGEVCCSPALPPSLVPLRMAGVRLAGASVSISVDGDTSKVSGLPPELRLVSARRETIWR